MTKLIKMVYCEADRENWKFYGVFTEKEYAEKKHSINATKEVIKLVTLETVIQIHKLLDDKKSKELVEFIKKELADNIEQK